jgi:hypothetical protein
MGKDVLHLGIGIGSLRTSQVVQPRDLVKQVVDDGNNDGNTNGISPDNNNSDNRSVAVVRKVLGEISGVRLLARTTGKPAEDTEESSNNVDTEDGADELPGWPGVAAASDEDEPVLSEGHFEEKYTLDGAEVLDDTAVGQEHAATDNPGTGRKENTEDDGDNPDLGQLPLDGASFEVCVIVGNGDGSQISEEGQEDDEVDGDGLVDDYHGCHEVDFQVQAKSNTVLDIGLHALENLASNLDGRDDGGKTGGKENDISGGLSGFGCTFDGNTTVGFLQRWSVVDTVTSHGSQMTTLLQHFDDLVLVLWEDFGETISLLNEIVLGSSAETTVDETFRVVDLSAKSKHLASFLSNSNGITSKHLDGKTEDLSFSDGGSGIVTRGVEHGKHAEQLPISITFLNSNTERTETTASELGGLCLVHIRIFLGAVGEIQDSLRGTLGASIFDAIFDDDGSDTLGNWVKRSEFLSLPALRQDFLGLWIALESKNCDLIDGIQRLDVVGRSKSSNSHHPVHIDAFSNERLANAKLVSSKRTSLVGAENIDTLRIISF